MSNIGFKGVDVRQTGSQLVFRAFLQTSAGALLGTGTTTAAITELQSDGTVKSYDFNDNTFKTTALTTPTLSLTHRPSNNAGTTTGFWTAALATLTGFTVGGMYQVIFNNSGASPTDQMREFQYGSDQGDLVVTAGATGVAYVQADATLWKTGAIPAPNVAGVPLADAKYLLGTIFATPATAGILDANVKNIANVAVSSTTAQIGVNAIQFAGQTITAASGVTLPATVASPTNITAASLGAAGVDAIVVEVGLNARQALAIAAAGIGGTIAGATSIGGTVTISGATSGAPTRVVMTGSANGNRTGITLSPPA